MGDLDEVRSAPITPRPTLPISSPPSQLHSPSLSRSPLLHDSNGDVETHKTPKKTRFDDIWSAPTTPPVSCPPSQLHSPSLTRSPLLYNGDQTEAYKTPTKARTPNTFKSPLGTPRFITPLASPLRKVLHLTKLNPHDAWLPITESRNGNAYYAAFHTLCSGIGVQALVLPLAFTVLGWAWGIICLTMAFIWQLYTLYLLIQLHESPENGVRYSRYMQLSYAAFGERLANILALFPFIYLSAGTCTTLIIIGGSTAKMLFQIMCGPTCSLKNLTTVEWYLVLTCAAIILSQLPNLNSIAGVSLVGAITAVGYCTIIWAVSVAEGKLPMVSYNPILSHSGVARVFDVLNALGIIAFAFRGVNLILEIQATMPSSEKHPSRVPMWRGVKFAYAIIAICLFPLAICGYWAYGQMIPEGGMLTALIAFHGKDVSRFVLALTCVFVIVSAITSFQIYAMPMLDDMESRYTMIVKKPCSWWLRAIMRIVYGFICFFIAVALPFLGSLAGLIGGLTLPLTLAYPCFMWLKIKKPREYSPPWWLNWGLGVLGMCLSGLLIAAGIYVLIDKGIKLSFFNPQ